MTTVRTRFAPSPTGFFHLGSARTALFNWAYARRHGGQFLLRIEDTDRARSTPEAERSVLGGLEWLGMTWDGEPVRQSEARRRHDEIIEQLLGSGRAYRCVCTAEEIEERKRDAIRAGRNWVYDGRCREAGHDEKCGPHTVRLRLPPSGTIAWDDGVFGASGKDTSEIGDSIIRRSDGSPLYHLAVVVDDLDMRITHVIRGEDHHRNTALQLAIYAALECTPPQFAHLPLIVNASGKKLSKRHDPVSVQQFREDGILPEALLNWLARIGWSRGDQEIFSAEEIAAHFALEEVHRSPGQADPGKLLWLNQQYLKSLPRDELLERLHPFLQGELGESVRDEPGLPPLVDLLRERSRTLVEMAKSAGFLYAESIAYDAKAAKKHLRPGIEPVLADLHGALGQLDTWNHESIERAFAEVCARHDDLKLGKIAQPVRVAVTGSAASPGIFETLTLLGSERTLKRIGQALETLRSG